MWGEGRISTGRGENLGGNSIREDVLRKREHCTLGKCGQAVGSGREAG